MASLLFSHEANSGRITLSGLLVLCVVALMLAFSGSAEAKKDKYRYYGPESGGYTGPGGDPTVVGGYTGPGPTLVSVEQALSMSDDSWVAVKGSITRNLGGKEYEFTDGTGTANLKIGHKAWQGMQVSASDTVELHGKVKKDWTRTRIDVKRVIKQ